MPSIKPMTLSVAAACLAMAAATFHAQNAGIYTDGPTAEVVVTATRGAKAIDTMPGAISVIGQQELSSQYLFDRR